MSLPEAAAMFAASLLMATISSAVLSHRLDQVGTWLGLSEGLLGLITALGADSPEIASAVTALTGGQHDLGTSVIIGSNLFNLAALLGLTAIVAGPLRCRRKTLLLNAGVSLAVTAIVAAELVTGMDPILAGCGLALVMVPYVVVCAIRPSRLKGLPGPSSIGGWLHEAVSDTEIDAGDETRPHPPSWADKLAIPSLVAVVVASSVFLVRAASAIGTGLGVPDIVLGALVLASLTGIPNVVAALRLGAQGRGEAVVSETFNSNSLNLLVGAYLPTLFLAVRPASPATLLTLGCLLGLTLAATLLFAIRGRLGAVQGGALVVAYAGFGVLLVRG